MSRFFARTLWRSGLLKAILFLLSLSLVSAFLLSSADIGQPNKLFYDLLLFVQSFWLHVLMLLWGYELAKNEQLLRLSRLPLSAPLARNRYEAARFGALALALAPVAFLLLAVNGIAATAAVAWQGVLYALAALLGGWLVLALSRFFPPVSAVLYAAALVMIGNGLDEFYLYTKLEESTPFLGFLAELFFVALPNFSLFDHQGAAVSAVVPGVWSWVLLPLVYAAVLGGALFTLSAWRFNRQPI